MAKHYAVIALALCVAAPTLLDAQSTRFRDFPEQFTLPVAQIDANSFEVVEANGAGNSVIWCAAGLFARNGLGLRDANVTITTPRGPSQSMPGRKGVVFTTAPVKGARPSIWPGIRRAGRSYTVTHAFAFCSDLDHVAVRTGPDTLIRR